MKGTVAPLSSRSMAAWTCHSCAFSSPAIRCEIDAIARPRWGGVSNQRPSPGQTHEGRLGALGCCCDMQVQHACEPGTAPAQAEHFNPRLPTAAGGIVLTVAVSGEVWMTLRRFIIERDIPKVGTFERQQLREAAMKSNEVLNQLAPDIQWVESYVADDKTFCVYLAKDEATIRKHAEISGFPASIVTEVRKMIDPTTARPD